jgi:hypothetical protein
MSRFKIAFTLEDAEVVGAVFDIEKDIEKEQEVNGADIGDIAEDETQARIEEVLSIEDFEEVIGAEIAENRRVEEVADNLTDLATVVSQIDEPSATDVALIQNSANMAVAGTDVDAQDILPAVENYKDMKVVAEGIGEKASAAMASLRDSGLAMAAKISDYLKKTFTSLKYYERKLIEAKAQIAELKAAGKKEMAVSMRGNKFFTGGDEGPVKDGADLVKRMNASVAFHDKFSTLFIEAEKSFAGAITKWISTGFDTNAGDAEKNKLFTAFFDNFLVKLSKVQGMERSADTKAGFDTFVNKNLLGNVAVAVRIPSNVKGYKDVTNAEIREWAAGSYVGTASTLGIRDRIAAAINGVPVTISVTVGDLDNLVRTGEKELAVMKKYLDKVYQAANLWSKVTPPTNSQPYSAYARLVQNGRSALFYTSFWTRSYGGNLLDAILKTVGAAARQSTGGIATEDFSVALEGVGGGIIGVLKTYIPGFGAISASKDRQKAADLTREIQEVAKQIAKLRGEAYKQAHDEGKITDDQYEKDSDANAADVVAWSWKDVMPITGTLRAYKAGSQAQDLSKELKAKLKELKALSTQAE